MKRKLLSLIFMFCLVVPAMFCLSACKDETPPNTYVVQFYNYDGSLIKQIYVEENSSATCKTPTKESTQYYIYEFAYWELLDGTNATEQLANVTTNLTVKATFIEVQPSYTISFYDEDRQTLLDTILVPRGEDLVFPTNKTKESDEYFNYTFEKWEDENGEDIAEITIADEDMSVYITWNVVRHSCTVNFYDEDKTTFLKSVIQELGSFYPTEVYKSVKTDWTFIDWYTSDDEPCDGYISISEDINLYAYYAKNVVVENGITYKLETVDYDYTEATGYVVISSDNSLVSGEIDLEKTFYTKKVIAINEKAFLNNENLTKVKLGSVKLIQAGSFYNCPNIVFEGNRIYEWQDGDYQCLLEEDQYYLGHDLYTIVYVNSAMKTLPDKATAVGGYAFTGCDSEEIVLGDNIMWVFEDAFTGCKNLKKISIGKKCTTFFGGVDFLSDFEVTFSDENPDYGVIEWYDTDKTTLLRREIYRKYHPSYDIVEKSGYCVSSWVDANGNPCEISVSGVINTGNLGLVKFYAEGWLPNVTQGLTSYKYSAASGGYEVVALDQSCKEVIIQSEINGYPVTSIASNLFKNNLDITSVVIPNSVIEIGASAFSGCLALATVIIDSETIANSLLNEYSCESLICYAQTVYVKSGLSVSNSTNLLTKFTKQTTSDKDGYDMYIRK